ncbi:MAG: 4Fe-4S binding protein [Anaerolineales bacterium]|nr:4Fe-4S binding protein [Anaerolineales bacterium]
MKKRSASLIRPSTREFIREARRAPGYSLIDFLHGYIYGRWTYLYIGMGLGKHPLAIKIASLLGRLGKLVITKAAKVKAPNPSANDQTESNGKISFADTYHGKVMPLESVKQLVLVNEDIRLPDLEQVIPYKRARAIILQNPDHIVVLECPCRSARPNPCLPLDVCLVVGEPFASFVMEHQPHKARRISQAEAVAILQAEDERGHVHHAFFKDAMLDRFYAICNCCSCCCGAMQAQRNGTPMLASSGYVAQVEETLCIGCQTCVEFCQFNALSVTDFIAQVDLTACMGCGVCVNHCEQGALSLRREASKGEPLEILSLLEQASR